MINHNNNNIIPHQFFAAATSSLLLCFVAPSLRFGLFLLINGVIIPMASAECYPGDFDITGMLNPQMPGSKFASAYCTAEDQGGGGPDITLWTSADVPMYGSCKHWGDWQDTGGCNQFGNLHYCSCNTKKCAQYGSFNLFLDPTAEAGAGCYCAMERDASQSYCYKSVTQCLPCGPQSVVVLNTDPPVSKISYRYRFGCGCISCITNNETRIAAYNAQLGLYNWPSGATCNNDGKRWRCGSGSCQNCPVGHRCPSPSMAPIPCDRGTYQDEIGASACKICMCPDGLFIPGTNIDLTAGCDAITGIMSRSQYCQKCDRCIDAKGNQACAIRDYAYGFWANGVCDLCKRCSGREYAYFGNRSSSLFCLTDKSPSENQCKKQYNNKGKCEFKDANVCEAPVIGNMPWRGGSRRMEGKQYTPGSKLKADLGFLPYFLECDSPVLPGNRWRQNSSDFMDNRMDWTRDCDPILTQECDTGYYATLTDDGGLASCTPCPADASGGGGLLLECTCRRGTASYTTLQALFGKLMFYVPHLGDEACINCMTSVFWPHSVPYQTKLIVHQEALVCNGGVAAKCDKPSEYVTQAGKVANCGPLLPDPAHLYNRTQIPLLDRTGCMICPPGTFIDTAATYGSANEKRYMCSRCAEGYYQELEGQPFCVPKRTYCQKGFYLISDPDDKAATDRNYECVACAQGCPEGNYYYIYALLYCFFGFFGSILGCLWFYFGLSLVLFWFVFGCLWFYFGLSLVVFGSILGSF